jgi:hypothetical protein
MSYRGSPNWTGLFAHSGETLQLCVLFTALSESRPDTKGGMDHRNPQLSIEFPEPADPNAQVARIMDRVRERQERAYGAFLSGGISLSRSKKRAIARSKPLGGASVVVVCFLLIVFP